jgi:light-regulated signal transduction histidine kinase (bacteriophytochrome)
VTGEEVIVRCSARPIRLEGDILGAVAINTDITAQKRAEAELARQAEELARSNADLQQFAYATSHDLQEPLRTIITFCELLLKRYRGKFGADADQTLGYIISGAQRMKGLIDSLLTYSRVVSAESVPLAPLRLEPALHWATMNLQTVMEETRATVTHDELPTVKADEVQIVQVFQNLISNAIKYRRPGQTPRIHVSAELRNDEWWISVRDNGVGIRPEFFERIFGVFKRLHGTEIPGAGIGLAIARRIIERHGGRIWVESEPDAGSTFWFTLPAV